MKLVTAKFKSEGLHEYSITFENLEFRIKSPECSPKTLSSSILFPKVQNQVGWTSLHPQP